MKIEEINNIVYINIYKKEKNKKSFKFILKFYIENGYNIKEIMEIGGIIYIILTKRGNETTK